MPIPDAVVELLLDCRGMKGAPDCPSARCGWDAGCRKVDDGSFICLCTHDFSLEIPGKPCPRNVVLSGKTNTSFSGVRSKTFPIAIFRNGIHLNHQSMVNNMSANLTGRVTEEILASEASLATTLAWVIPVTSIVALIVFIISVMLLRWFRIYRMTNRKRTIARRPANISPPTDFCTINTKADASKSLFLLREWIEIQEEIGEGCFGKIFRGRLSLPDILPMDPAYINLESGEAVAIKVLKTPSFDVSSTKTHQDFLREADTMSKFSHENILSLRGIVINEFCIGSWIVSEYMELGDLSHLLRTTNSILSPNCSLNQVDLFFIANQIANGMKYLSSQNFVHRDLACRNCLVSKRSPLHAHSTLGNFIIKISDFGMSRDLHANDYYKMESSKLLPVRWMAPESILFGKFTPESDVWSFGVVLWEIFSMGALPYYGHSNEEVVKMIVNGVILQPTKSTPTEINQLMIDCWQTSPSARLTFSNICDKFVGLVSSFLTSETTVDYLQTLLNDDNVIEIVI